MKKVVIWFVRHEAHGEGGAPKNALTPDGRAAAIEVGRRLAERFGLKELDAFVSSPAPRAVETGLCVMQGLGTMCPRMKTDERLGDLALDGEFNAESVAALKAEAKAAGEEPETFFVTGERFRGAVFRRGHEGAQAIRDAAGAMPDGSNVLVTSHGGSRMELTVMAITGDFLSRATPRFWFDRGGVARIELAVFHQPVVGWCEDRELTKVEYLGRLDPAAGPAHFVAGPGTPCRCL